MYTFAKDGYIVKTGAIFNNVVAEESNLKNIDQRRD
jgi:hypothetical protein